MNLNLTKKNLAKNLGQGEERHPLAVKNLTFAYAEQLIVERINFIVPEHHFVGIVGANGSGKSTILKCIYGSLQPQAGDVYLDGINTKNLKSKEIARYMAVVGQENTVAFNFTVEEVVAMGRTPYKRAFELDTRRDHEAVQEALDLLRISHLAKRSFMHLSGGEKQRALIARALAQDTKLLVLDEPTNHLDISFQLEIFEQLRKLGKTVLSAIHDLNLASLFCDDLVVLGDEQLKCVGKTEDVLTAELIREVFNVSSDVSYHDKTGKKNVVFLPKNIKGE